MFTIRPAARRIAARCARPLIVRDWYEIRDYALTPAGHCPDCGTPLAGCFGGWFTPFGARRYRSGWEGLMHETDTQERNEGILQTIPLIVALAAEHGEPGRIASRETSFRLQGTLHLPKDAIGIVLFVSPGESGTQAGHSGITHLLAGAHGDRRYRPARPGGRPLCRCRDASSASGRTPARGDRPADATDGERRHSGTADRALLPPAMPRRSPSVRLPCATRRLLRCSASVVWSIWRDCGICASSRHR